MTLLLNVLWIVLGGGWLIALEYCLAGLALCLTVIGIPFGVQCFKIAGLALLPFGKTIADRPSNPLGFFFNVLWFVLAGVWIFLSQAVLAIALALSIIGIPFAVQHAKMAVLALAPFGTEVRRA